MQGSCLLEAVQSSCAVLPDVDLHVESFLCEREALKHLPYKKHACVARAAAAVWMHHPRLVPAVESCSAGSHGCSLIQSRAPIRYG